MYTHRHAHNYMFCVYTHAIFTHTCLKRKNVYLFNVKNKKNNKHPV